MKIQTKRTCYWWDVVVSLRSPTGINKVLLSCLSLFFKPFLNGPREASQGHHLPVREQTEMLKGFIYLQLFSWLNVESVKHLIKKNTPHNFLDLRVMSLNCLLYLINSSKQQQQILETGTNFLGIFSGIMKNWSIIKTVGDNFILID